jgi:hypothetical protein
MGSATDIGTDPRRPRLGPWGEIESLPQLGPARSAWIPAVTSRGLPCGSGLLRGVGLAAALTERLRECLIRRRSVLPTTSRLASGNDRLTMIHSDGTVEEIVTQQGFTCHIFIHRCVARWNPGRKCRRGRRNGCRARAAANLVAREWRTPVT